MKDLPRTMPNLDAMCPPTTGEPEVFFHVGRGRSSARPFPVVQANSIPPVWIVRAGHDSEVGEGLSLGRNQVVESLCVLKKGIAGVLFRLPAFEHHLRAGPESDRRVGRIKNRNLPVEKGVA